jgi:CDP-diglyceride synthetase
MKARLVVAAVCVPLLLAMLLLLPAWVLTIAVSIMSVIGVHEVLAGTGMIEKKRMYYCGMIFSALVPLWFHWSGNLMLAIFAVLLLVCLAFAEALASGGAIKTGAVTGHIFFSLFIPLALSVFVQLRKGDCWQLHIILPIAIAFISDAGGLFAGMLFGKHKLAPLISPKKTVEGAIGALIFGALAAVGTGIVAQLGGGFVVNYGYLVLYGLAGSVISQFGDLCFSYIKREYKLKDFGSLFPGHGGVLDRFDSVIFCAPLCLLFITLLPAIWISVGV